MTRIPALALLTLPAVANAGISFGDGWGTGSLMGAGPLYGVIFGDPLPAGLVSYGDPLPAGLTRCEVSGSFQSARWWGDDGDETRRLARARSLEDSLYLLASAGTWTDVELVLTGPLTVSRGGVTIATLDQDSLWVTLDQPLDHDGGALTLRLNIPGSCADDESIEAALEAGATGSMR